MGTWDRKRKQQDASVRVFSQASAFPAPAMLLLLGTRLMLELQSEGRCCDSRTLPSFSSSPGYEHLGPLLPSSLRRGAGKILVDVHGSTEGTTQCQSWEEAALRGNTPKFMTNPSLPTLRLCKTEKFPSGSFNSPEPGGASHPAPASQSV